MEAMRIWWSSRSSRDRRAMVVFLLVVPVILFWYLVTLPLQDRLEVARRVLTTRRAEADEVQKLLQEYAVLQQQANTTAVKASAAVVSTLEQAFSGLPDSGRPALNRANVVVFGENRPGAHVRAEGLPPHHLWNLLEVIASSGVCLSEFEISAAEQANSFSLSIKAWLPEKK